MQKTIVLPEGDDIRVVEAAGILSRRKLCKLELVGNAETIERHASTLGISLEGISVVEPTKHPRYDDMAEQVRYIPDKTITASSPDKTITASSPDKTITASSPDETIN